MSDTKRSHEAIADEAAQRYIADSLAAPHIMFIQRRSFIAGYEAAAALREESHSSAEKRDNPITVTDAMAIRGKMASRDVYVGISDVRRIIEAALKVRSEE